jgi:hypothetical protein
MALPARDLYIVSRLIWAFRALFGRGIAFLALERGNCMPRKRFSGILTTVMLGSTISVAAAQEVAPPAQQPQRHVVQLGETLWGIAHLYFGDPLLWPQIYRMNTTVVEDPHWIFPGEELLLVPGDRTQVAVEEPAPTPVEPTETPPVQPQAEERPVEAPPLELPAETPAEPPPPAAEGPTVFARVRQAAATPTLSLGGAAEFRALRAGDFYGAGFLTENQDFPWAEVLGHTDPAGIRAQIGRTAFLGQVIRVRAPVGANYQVGDSLVTYLIDREVRGGWGRIVMPTSVTRVLHVAGRDVLAEVLTQFDQVRAGQVALPAEPFPSVGTARPQPVADGVLGGVVTLRALREVPKQFDVMFIDLGREAGIVPGDVLELLPRPEDVQVAERPADAIGLLQVVHVRDRSATALLSGIFTPGIRATLRDAGGAPVRLIRKMPS